MQCSTQFGWNDLKYSTSEGLLNCLNRIYQQEFERMQENDLSKFKEMLGKASRWHKANNLRNYIKAVEEKEMSNNDSIELREWLDWARKKADWYDPFIESKDILLNEGG